MKKMKYCMASIKPTSFKKDCNNSGLDFNNKRMKKEVDRPIKHWEALPFLFFFKTLINPLVVFGLLSLSLCSRSKMTGLQTTAYKSVIMLYYH